MLSSVLELLEIDEAVQVLDTRDHKRVKDEQVDIRNRDKERRSFKESYLTKWETHRAAMPKPKAPAKKKAKVLRVVEGVAACKLPLDSDILQKDVTKYIPSDSSIWKGNKCGTWNGHYPGYKRCSGNWRKEGSERKALIVVVGLLWDSWCEANGIRVKDSPCEGLLDVLTDEYTGPSAGSSGD